MFTVGLQCDGCGELLGVREVPPDDYTWVLEDLEQCKDLEKDAEGQGWDSPDGEQWFCPTCRLARDRETLITHPSTVTE
jgi:hypothetical protein